MKIPRTDYEIHRFYGYSPLEAFVMAYRDRFRAFLARIGEHSPCG